MRLTILVLLALVTIVLGMIVNDAVDDRHLPTVRATTTTSTTAIPAVFDAPISDTAAVAPVVVTRHEIPRAHETAPISVWDRVAACESNGRWDDTRDGYFGGLHFMAKTWRDAGGAQYAPTADLATREEQIDVARHWLARTSVASQWPVCGPLAGLTMADAA